MQSFRWLFQQVEKQAQATSNTSFMSSIAHSTSASNVSTVTINVPEPSQPSLLSPSNKTKQSTTSQSVENLAAGTSVPVLNSATSPAIPANKYQPQSNSTPLIPGYSFAYNAMMSMYLFVMY